MFQCCAVSKMKSKVLFPATIPWSFQDKLPIVLEVENSKSRIILVEFNFIRL
jgi:hypothetical protein